MENELKELALNIVADSARHFDQQDGGTLLVNFSYIDQLCRMAGFRGYDDAERYYEESA